ncbi:MAG: hypothetical protein ABI767_16275 [Rhodanobacter sp.]
MIRLTPTQPANPVRTASRAAHRSGNFEPSNSISEKSIVSAQGEKLYQDNKAATAHYRSVVMPSRIDLHDVLNP